jgi:hypothetical protein
MQPILDSLPQEWEALIWNNGVGQLLRLDLSRTEYGENSVSELLGLRPEATLLQTVSDLSVYGRYAAIEYASHDLIYVQDDDVIVSDPQAIVNAWELSCLFRNNAKNVHVVCNMPSEFRHDFYVDHALVGFGASFYRDAPKRAFDRFMEYHDHMIPLGIRQDVFWRTCDVVFTGLTPRVLVDVPKTNLPYASDDNRMWKQAEHQGERQRMLDLVKQVRG